MTNHVDYEINKELGECYLFMGEYEKKPAVTTPRLSSATAPTRLLISALPPLPLAWATCRTPMTFYCKANAVKESDRSLSGMGMIEAEQGSHEEAFSHFVRALEYNPEYGRHQWPVAGMPFPWTPR